MLSAAALCFNLFILLCQQITEAYPSTFSVLRNEKPLEKNVFIRTKSETNVILEDIDISNLKEHPYEEIGGTEEKNISNSSSFGTTKVDHLQLFTVTTSLSVRHKINSTTPLATVNVHGWRFNTTTSVHVHHKINSTTPLATVNVHGWRFNTTTSVHVRHKINSTTPLATVNVHGRQRYTAMTSLPVHHKINSVAPLSKENNFQTTVTGSSIGNLLEEVNQRNKRVMQGLSTTAFHPDERYSYKDFSNPVAKDYVTMQRILCKGNLYIDSIGNISACNKIEYNITLNKASTSVKSLRKQYFNTEYHREELKLLCAQIKYLSRCSNNNHSDWKVFQKDYDRLQEEYGKFQEELFMWKTVLTYIDPVLYAIIITMGVGGNGMLVIIFVRHPVILTPPNIVVLVIAICDLLALLIVAPLDYLTEFYGGDFLGDMGCKIYIYVRLMIRSVTELCLVLLSGQRFLSTIFLGRRGALKARLESESFIWIVMIAVWIFSLVFCMPTIFVIEFTDGTCFPHIKDGCMAQLFFFFIVTFFVILPFPMVIFNGLTALRLGRTTRKDFPHTRMSRLIEPRYRSARVITIVTVFYACVFAPRTLWDATVSWRHLNRRSAEYFTIDQVVNFLYFADSCTMPFILFFLSSVYRKLFRQFWQYEYYLCINRTKENTCNTNDNNEV